MVRMKCWLGLQVNPEDIVINERSQVETQAQ